MTKAERDRIYRGILDMHGKAKADEWRARNAAEARAEGQRRRTDNKRSHPRDPHDFSVREFREACPRGWLIRVYQVKGHKTAGGWGGRWTASNEHHNLEATTAYELVMAMLAVGVDIRERIGIDVHTGEVDLNRANYRLPNIL